jgi:hypothetical protein
MKGPKYFKPDLTKFVNWFYKIIFFLEPLT